MYKVIEFVNSIFYGSLGVNIVIYFFEIKLMGW